MAGAGEFRQAAPQYGRFRNYVKAVLFHLLKLLEHCRSALERRRAER